MKWCESLGISLDVMFRETKVKDPRKHGRASKARSAKPGGAPRVRKRLVEYLLSKEYERGSDFSTIGRRVIGLRDWQRAGELLLELNEDGFFELLHAARTRGSSLALRKLADEQQAEADRLDAAAAWLSPLPLPAEQKAATKPRKSAPDHHSRTERTK